MLPKWHIFLGAAFTALIWFFVPTMPVVYLSLVFLSSFLIDFDHYANAVIKNKNPSLNEAFKYHERLKEQEKRDLQKGIRKKSDFHLFHTVEFHTLVGLLGLVWSGFFFIFIGMLFHSLLDLSSLLFTGVFHRREYFFFNWARKGFRQN